MNKFKINIIIKLLILTILSALICGFFFSNSSPKDNRDYYKETICAYKDKKLNKALMLSKNIVPKNRDESGKTDLLKAKINSELGYIQQANKHYDKALNKLDLIRDAILYEKAKALATGNQFNKALLALSTICDKHPNSPFMAKSIFQKGEIYYLQKDYRNALISYKNLLDKYPNSSNAEISLLRIARIYEKQRKEKKAYFYYKKMEIAYPGTIHKDIVNNRINQLSNKYKNLTFKPESKDLYKAGKYYHNAEQYGKSTSLLKKLINSQSYAKEAPYAMLLIGLNKYVTRHYDSALLTFKELIKKYPKHKITDDAHFYRAKLYEAKKLPYKAIKEYKKIIYFFGNGDHRDKALYNTAQIYLKKKNRQKAFSYFSKIFIDHPDSNLADDAIWEIGNYYYKKGKYEKALKFLKYAKKLEVHGDYTARCLYWAAKSAQKLKKEDEAFNIYSLIYNEYPHTYYAYRVWEKFAKEHEGTNVLIASRGVSPKSETKNTDALAKKRLTLLLDFLYDEEAINEINHLTYNGKQNQSLEYKILISKKQFKNGDYYQCIKNIEFAVNDKLIQKKELPQDVITYSYPKAYWDEIQSNSNKYGVDPYLISALIREESRFNPQIKSWANAMGLMQIMPTTGKDIASRLKLKHFNTKQLNNPKTNIEMGTYYFAKLLKIFDNNTVLALAGYNGGPTNTYKWWNNKKTTDIDEFIEDIPFDETKRYIKKVLKSYWIYKKTYSYANI